MLRDEVRNLALVSIGILWFGLSTSVVLGQSPTQAKSGDQSQTIVKVGDYVITVKELDQIIASYPEGSISSREEKSKLVESLITTKLFALAARSEKLDAAEDFPKTRQRARENALIYAYLQRYVHPKFSEEAARKYFEAHPDKYRNFGYSRNQIIELLRDQALSESNESLMKQWSVRRKDDVLKDLDLRNPSDSSLVLAQVGPENITVADLKELADLYPSRQSVTFETRKQFLDMLVLDRLYLLTVKKAGWLEDPEIQQRLDRADDQLLAARYIQFVQGKVTNEDAKAYYQTHKEEFKRPDQIWLRQIVVSTQKEAQEVKAKLNRGETFEEVAKTDSIDRPSAMRGGDIGWVRKGRLHPEVEKVAFQLDTHQVSEPIKSPEGYHILRVEDRLEGAVKPFEEVGPNILMQLRAQAVADERQRLMKIYQVTINQKLF